MAQLSLWLLQVTGPQEDFDETRACVVAAPDKAGARQEAARWHGTEDSPTWLDEKWSACTLIGTAAGSLAAGLVIRDFRRRPHDGDAYRP